MHAMSLGNRHERPFSVREQMADARFIAELNTAISWLFKAAVAYSEKRHSPGATSRSEYVPIA
jgi:membrane-bound lytic murein transglycosylase MltF